MPYSNIFERGFSTLEILVASTIALTSISASAMVMYSAQELTTSVTLKNEALQIVQEQVSKVTTQTSLLPIDESTEQRGIYTINREIHALSRFVNELTITVSWVQRNQTLTESASLTLPILDSAESSDTCALYWVGTWITPEIINSWQLPNSAQITDLDVLGDLVVVTTDDATLSLPDLYIFDLRDVADPRLISSLNTGPGLAAIQVVGSTAFVANTSVTSQLQMINLADPKNPSLLTSLSMPNPGVDGIIGHSLYVHGDFVYLGTLKNTSAEFYIIDKTNFAVLGSFETDTQINSIIVDRSKAYLATPNQSQLRVLDVSNPGSIGLVSSFSASGYQVQDGRSLDVFGSSVFLGRTVGGFNNPSNHELFNLGLQESGQLTQNFSIDLASSARSLMVRDNLAFVGTNDPTKEWQVWGLGVGGAFLPWSQLDLPASVVTSDCEQQYFYVALESASQIVIIGSE